MACRTNLTLGPLAMPRRLRRDEPGLLHHVMSRGIARRAIFETRRDVRFFLACLAKQVRAGDLEILVLSVMTTHFHLLVRSPRGRLSRAMQRALDAYSRWFNRSRRRDGPLFRARFVNRIVDSEAYALAVIRYIDRNPVAARLTDDPFEYPHGSARHYATSRAPRWLARAAVHELLGGGPGEPWDPARYVRILGDEAGPGEQWLVDRRLRDSTPRADDPLDDLLRAAPGQVREWMRAKARLADGTAPGLPVASPLAIRRSIQRLDRGSTEDRVVLLRSSAPRAEVLEAGLLRLCAGLRQQEIADRMGVLLTTAQKRVRLFARAITIDESLLSEASLALEAALEEDFGHVGGRRPRPRLDEARQVW